MATDDDLSRLLHQLTAGAQPDDAALDRIYVRVDEARAAAARSRGRWSWRAITGRTGPALAPITVVVALVLSVSWAALLAGRSAAPTPSGMTNAPSATATALRPSALPVVPAIRVSVAGRPYRVIAADGSIWAADGGQVNRIDPVSGRIVATIHVGSSRASIGAGPAGIWVSDVDDGTVARLDPATNRLRAAIAVAAPDFIAVGVRDVWVASSRSGVVTRIDATSNLVVAAIDAGYGPSQLVVSQAAVWVPNDQSAISSSTAAPSLLTRIDPTANAVVASVTMDTPSITDFTYGREAILYGDRVWVLDDGGGVLTAVDAANHRVRSIPLGRHLGGVVALGDVLWVTVQPPSGAGEVVRVVPSTGAVTTSLGVSGNATSTSGLTSITTFGSSLWVAADWSDRHEVMRLDPP